MKNNKSIFVLFLLLIIFVAGLIVLTGFFVIQPMGPFPGGITIWFFRPGTGLKFIDSPDGIQLRRTGEVSLMGRSIAITLLPVDNIIMRLPYIKAFYLVSTGGKEYEQ